MANRYYRESEPDTSGGKGFALSRSKPGLPMQEKSFKWPALPGRPRTIHKPLGRRVKKGVEEDY